MQPKPVLPAWKGQPPYGPGCFCTQPQQPQKDKWRRHMLYTWPWIRIAEFLTATRLSWHCPHLVCNFCIPKMFFENYSGFFPRFNSLPFLWADLPSWLCSQSMHQLWFRQAETGLEAPFFTLPQKPYNKYAQPEAVPLHKLKLSYEPNIWSWLRHPTTKPEF